MCEHREGHWPHEKQGSGAIARCPTCPLDHDVAESTALRLGGWSPCNITSVAYRGADGRGPDVQLRRAIRRRLHAATVLVRRTGENTAWWDTRRDITVGRLTLVFIGIDATVADAIADHVTVHGRNSLYTGKATEPAWDAEHRMYPFVTRVGDLTFIIADRAGGQPLATHYQHWWVQRELLKTARRAT